MDEQTREQKTITFEVSDNGRYSTKLKTIEVDVDKKIFKVNGFNFGSRCSKATIYLEPNGITMVLDKQLTFLSGE